MTEYDEKQPLLSLESYHYTTPQNVGLDDFTIQDPDSLLQALIPPGSWKWLRGGDDLTRQDKLWRWTRSWTGFIPGPDYNQPFSSCCTIRNPVDRWRFILSNSRPLLSGRRLFRRYGPL